MSTQKKNIGRVLRFSKATITTLINKCLHGPTLNVNCASIILYIFIFLESWGGFKPPTPNSYTCQMCIVITLIRLSHLLELIPAETVITVEIISYNYSENKRIRKQNTFNTIYYFEVDVRDTNAHDNVQTFFLCNEFSMNSYEYFKITNNNDDSCQRLSTKIYDERYIFRK